MRKKIKKTAALFAIITLFAATDLFAAKSMIKGTIIGANMDLKVMDLPLVDGIAYFSDTCLAFFRIARTLAVALMLLCLCWNAFRLWFGTVQIRKAAVDIGGKMLVFTVLFSVYTYLQVGVFETAIKIGLYAGGGAKEISRTFAEFAKDLETKTKASNSIMLRIASAMKQKGAENGGTVHLSDSEFAQWNSLYGGNLKQAAKDWNIEIKTASNSKLYVGEDYNKEFGENEAITASKTYGDYDRDMKFAIYKGKSEDEFKQMKKDAEQEYKYLALVRAFDDVCNQNSVWKAMAQQTESGAPYYSRIPSAELTKLESQIQRYVFAPFITETTLQKGKEGFTPQNLQTITNNGKAVLLSPAALMKTGVLIANVMQVAAQNEYNVEAQQEESENESTQEKLKRKLDPIGFAKKEIKNTVEDIMQTVYLVAMTIFLLMSCVYFCIEYCMCIIEYWICTCVAILYIPCILFDGTKTYAAKIAQIFVSYFLKVVVMMLCIMWAFSMYLRTGLSVLSSGEPLSLINIANLIFTISLGLIVTQNGPKIAMSVMSGSPSLTLGDAVHTANGIAHAGMRAARTAGAVAKPVAKQAGKFAQASARNTAAGFVAGFGNFAGTKNANMPVGERLAHAMGAGIAGSASAWKTDIKNKATSFLTGQKTQGAGQAHVGSGSAEQAAAMLGSNSDKAKKHARADGTVSYRNKYDFEKEKAQRKYGGGESGQQGGAGDDNGGDGGQQAPKNGGSGFGNGGQASPQSGNGAVSV